jgi:hypothetical protein
MFINIYFGQFDFIHVFIIIIIIKTNTPQSKPALHYDILPRFPKCVTDLGIQTTIENLYFQRLSNNVKNVQNWARNKSIDVVKLC